jgi:asparagine synthetase B (glutamine-hydrolysing)
MLEDNTPIVGVKKILDGNLLLINLKNQNISQQAYYTPFSGNYFEKGKDKALGLMHDIFQKSVILEYEKDGEIEKKSLALLSGGLDSRLGVFYALENSFVPENILCFSQSDYLDHSISEKIAKDYHLHYEFIALDGGSYLNKIDQLTKISEGCGLFTGGIHVQYALDNLKYENFGIFHSGQIGDGILGGFNSEPFRKKPSYFKIIQQKKFLPKVESSLAKILGNYETEEYFLLRNIAYNRTVLGAQVLQQKAYQTSPFMSKEMLNFAFSLPEEWKYKHHFYIDWIKKYAPQSTNYRWERTLLKPDATWKTQLGDKFLKPIFKRINEKILKTPEKSSMYPYAFYFEQSEELQKYYQNYFNENTCRLDSYKELQKDVSELFSSNSFYDKALALNILSIFKLYF